MVENTEFFCMVLITGYIMNIIKLKNERVIIINKSKTHKPLLIN